MPLPSVIAGPARIFYFDRTSTVLAAAAQLSAEDMYGIGVSSDTENPAVGIDGATRIQQNTEYNLSVAVIGAHSRGGLAMTDLPTNFAYTTGAGDNAIKAVVEVDGGALGIALFIDDALAAVAAAPLSVRNGNAGTAEVVCYYEPSPSAVTRADIVSIMGSEDAYAFTRKSFGETTGPTQLVVQPTVATVQRNAGSDIPLVTAYNVQVTASLLASGKEAMASVLAGIATASGGLKTNQSANMGFRGLGVPSARPIEVVGPGEVAGQEDSVILFSALKQSSEAITKAWEKENASQLPVTFVSGEDLLMQGIHGTFEVVKN